MRNYTFKCWDCNKEFGLSDTKLLNTVECPDCGCGCSWIRIVYGDKQRGRHAEPEGFWSNTMGTSIEQLPEERRAHPNWKFGDDGRVWIPNLKEQRKMVRELGMVNKDDICG